MAFSSAAKRRLLISASLAALVAWPAQATSSTALSGDSVALFGTAAAATQNATGAELLKKTQRGLSVALAAAKKLAQPARAKAAPFFKAVKKADKALKDLAAAVAKKDAKAVGRALSAAGKEVGALNSTFKHAKISDKATKEGMRAFNAAWNETVKRLKGAKSTPEARKKNNRRISAVKKKVKDQRGKRSSNPAEDAALAYLLGLLDDAMAMNRSDDYGWYSNYLFDEAMGWYGGYYDYLGTYDPATAGLYLDDYGYWRSVYDDYLPSYDGYYGDGYDWAPYEASAPVNVNVEINNNYVDNSIINEGDTNIENIGAQADSVTPSDTELANMEAADAALAAAPPADVAALADTPDPEVDAATDQPMDEATAQQVAQEQERDGEAEADPATLDSDGDGQLDAVDTDDDNDGVPDAEDGDDDGDGVADVEETPETAEADTDGDGQPDSVDDDDDNDGTPDATDADDNGDGQPDEADTGTDATDDADHDGISDADDPDDDNDGTPDAEDTDDDGDGIADDVEAADDNDFDNDGVDDAVDTDDDNDGTEDAADTDDDGDGIEDEADTDDDNDGVDDADDGADDGGDDE